VLILSFVTTGRHGLLENTGPTRPEHRMWQCWSHQEMVGNVTRTVACNSLNHQGAAKQRLITDVCLC